jgi:hypothetical protein
MIRYQNEEKLPTLNQLQHWIILSLKWPDMARWLQFNSTNFYYTDNENADRNKEKVEQKNNGSIRINATAFRLNKLENLALACNNNSIEQWKKGINDDLDLHLDIDKTPWIMDISLMRFFQEEVEESKQQDLKPLSEGAGKGLY